MTGWEALLYGAVQGITEYLPISSSAHLILLPHFLGTRDPGLAFDVFLHIGTLMATLIYFRRDWITVLEGFREPFLPKNRMWILIAAATIPALAVGAAFHSQIEAGLRGSTILALSLAIGGVLLVAADRFCAVRHDLEQLTLKQAIQIGFFQCLALIPGMSRSGSTMMGARYLGLDRTSAARFSFMISAPVTLAAIIFEMRKWRELVAAVDGFGTLFIAGFSSFVFGMLAIGVLIRGLRKFGFATYAVYRVAMAIVIFTQLQF
jgi:undecaprenyl-diphosphatase